jgi:hypothetical protein
MNMPIHPTDMGRGLILAATVKESLTVHIGLRQKRVTEDSTVTVKAVELRLFTQHHPIRFSR